MPRRPALATLRHPLAAAVRALRNRRRQRQRAPDYVLFTLGGSYPELAPSRGEWWQRLVPGRDESLRALGRQFEQVAADPRVTGVVLHLRPLAMPAAHLQTLRGLIAKLRQSGKRVVTWSQMYDTAQLYLASAADEVLLQPGGSIAPLGLHREVVFLADTLEEVGLAADAVRISPYKSAPEVFTRRESTEEARANLEWLTEDAWADLLGVLAEGWQVSVEEAQARVDGAPYTDLQAQAAGLVGGLLHEEALPTHLARNGQPATLEPWEVAEKTLLLRPLPGRGKYVGLIRIEGAIVSGASRRPPFQPPIPIPLVLEEVAGDQTVVQAARAALADEQAAAVVLFVESPGGSATASEAMAAALERLAAAKPLVVAMGSVAASGGYYVATPARWIVAQPGTFTGSIGVFAMKGVAAGLYDKLRLGRETFTRGQHVALYDPAHPFTEAERAKVWEGISRTYEVFLERVARSRGMTMAEVDAVGGGRVWTGRQALAHGLVDELGGLEQALRKARALADLPEDAPLRAIHPGKKPLPPRAPNDESSTN